MADHRPGADDFAAVGLYNPGAPDAAARLALLEYLVGIGATLDDFQLVGANELPALATTISLFPDRNFLTLEEVAERSGADPEFIRKLWRAAGFADPDPGVPTLTTEVAQLFTSLNETVEFFGEDAILKFVRVIGASASRLADAAVSLFIVNAAPAAIEADPSFVELARVNFVATAYVPNIVNGFDLMLRYHMQQARRFDTPGTDGIDVHQRTIGFVDLVGSTELAVSLSPKALDDAFARFDATASDVVSGNGGRMVKLIGDEVMFAAPTPAVGATIALALIDAFADHEVLPLVRAALATGEVIARDGDYSGATVNRAARAVGLARPGTLLVDEETADALDAEQFAVRFVRAFSMKGFDDRVKLFRIRRFV